MKCESYLELINAYFDNELDKDEEKQLFEHLEICPECKKEFEFIKEELELLKEIPQVDLPEGYHDELMNKLKDSKVYSFKREKKKSTPWFKYSAIAASFLILGIVGGIGSTAIFNGTGISSGNSAQFAERAVEESAASADAAMPEMAMDNAATGYGMEKSAASAPSAPMDSRAVVQEQGVTSESPANTNSIQVDERKIIKDYYIDMEVENFDDSIELIRNLAQENGGYVDNMYSDVYYTDKTRNVSLKNGSISIRIPAESSESIKEKIQSFGKVTNTSENSQDITSQYVDTAGRLNAKRAEEQRLLEILDKCETVDELVSVESRLGDVRAEIEAYTTAINNWDKLVDYSLVSINLTEVNDSSIEPIDSDFGAKIKNSFIQSINSVIEGLQGFVLWATRISVPAVITILVVAVAALVIRRYWKKHKNK